MLNLDRLDAAIRAVCPIVGVSGSANTTIVFSPEATEEQRAAAAEALDRFDWSDAAQAAWEAQQRRAAVLDLLTTSNDPLVVGIRALGMLIMGRVGPAVAALGGQPMTWPVAQQAFAQIVMSGQAEV